MSKGNFLLQFFTLPSFLPSFLPSYLSSIALSEMAKDHFFCFADCANEEQEGRKDSTLDSSAARFDM